MVKNLYADMLQFFYAYKHTILPSVLNGFVPV